MTMPRHFLCATAFSVLALHLLILPRQAYGKVLNTPNPHSFSPFAHSLPGELTLQIPKQFPEPSNSHTGDHLRLKGSTCNGELVHCLSKGLAWVDLSRCCQCCSCSLCFSGSARPRGCTCRATQGLATLPAGQQPPGVASADDIAAVLFKRRHWQHNCAACSLQPTIA